MTLSATAVRGDTKRVVRDIQKICTRHFKSMLKPGAVLTGIMQCECRLRAFKGALNSVDGPKTTLCTGHKHLRHSPRAEIPPQRCHPRNMRSSVRHLPFVPEEVSGQGFPCESLTAKIPSKKVKGSVAYTINEDSRQSLLILSRACGIRRVSRGQECTTRPRGRSALAKGAPASINTTAVRPLSAWKCGLPRHLFVKVWAVHASGLARWGLLASGSQALFDRAPESWQGPALEDRPPTVRDVLTFRSGEETLRRATCSASGLLLLSCSLTPSRSSARNGASHAAWCLSIPPAASEPQPAVPCATHRWWRRTAFRPSFESGQSGWPAVPTTGGLTNPI